METRFPNSYDHPTQLAPVSALESQSAQHHHITLPGIDSLLKPERSFSQESENPQFTPRFGSSFSSMRTGSMSPRPSPVEFLKQRRPSSAASPLSKRSHAFSPPSSAKPPHWSMDRRGFLPTPPTSGDNIKPADSFGDAHEAQDALFQSHEQEPAHYTPLFHSSPRQVSTRPSEQWDSNWSPKSQETLDEFDEDDTYSTPESPVLTGAELEDQKRTNGYVESIRRHMQQSFGDLQAKGILPPSEEEYMFVLNALDSLKTKYIEENSSPVSRPKKRKALEDTSANRRAFSSLAPKSIKLSKKHASVDSKSSVVRHKRTAKPSEKNSSGETKSARAKSSKAAFSKNYLDYPNYAPDWSVARDPESSRSVVKTWPGHVDLATDPLRHEMTSYELKAAEALSLDCSKYLCLKRQLFAKYVDILRRRHDGEKTENWNRTAAQNATNIDVNKVSQVFNWFDSMGLFNESHFEKFLTADSQ